MSTLLLIYRTIKLVIFFTISISTYADDKDISNLHITSDTLIINRVKQKAEYLGNVVVYFDNAILRTEELYIFYKTIDNKQTIDYIVVPTKLSVEKKINNELLLADSGKYFLDNKQLILLGNVVLERNNNILKTNKLIYYVDIVNELSTGQAPWYLCRPKGRVQAALAPYPPAPDVLYIV